MEERVKFVTVTQDAEKIMSYVARVSNPANQDNPNYEKLLAYCIKHEHWSVFETPYLTIEITTSRAIAAQILRHRSFTFQEFSQRYAIPTEYVKSEARSQDVKNRQNSIDDLSCGTKQRFLNMQTQVWESSKRLYDEAIELGIAKECARFLLPLSTQTTLYMTGNVRSWIHYIGLRTKQGTQLEHKDLADECKKIFINQFPVTSKALEWT